MKNPSSHNYPMFRRWEGWVGGKLGIDADPASPAAFIAAVKAADGRQPNAWSYIPGFVTSTRTLLQSIFEQEGLLNAKIDLRK